MIITRGRGSYRGISLCAIAALGLALAGCGGSGSSASVAPSSSLASSKAPPSAGVQGASSSGNANSGSTTSGSTSSGSTGSGSTGSGSTTSNPPTATAGTVTINWVAPTQNVDGSPLTNLAGYNIHYGTTSGNYTQTISISNPGIATYVVSNLSPGTYYFTVAAVNSSGTESPLSSQVSTTVN